MKQALCIFLLILLSIAGQSQVYKQYNIPVKENFNIQQLELNTINISFNIHQLAIDIYNDNYLSVNVDGYRNSMIKGEPELPILTKTLFFPIGVSPKIEIFYTDTEKLTFSKNNLKGLVKPSVGSILKSDNRVNRNLVLSERYKANNYINKKAVSFKYIGILRNQQVYELEFCPVSYNPVKGKIVVTNIAEAKLFWSEDINIHPKWQFTSKGKTNQYNLTVANNKLVETIVNKTLLVVAPLKYKNTLKSFVYWKKCLGYNVSEAYIGEDIADASKTTIHSFIKNFYLNPDEGFNPLSYLVLVGDVSDIPAWNATTGSFSTDLYFAEFTDDYLPDILYGRISVTDTVQLQNVIDKTIFTEKFGSNLSEYQNKHLLVSGVDPTYAPVYGNGAVNYITKYYSNNLQGINPSYYLYGSGSTIVSNNSLAKQSIIDDINTGVGFAYYTAHCGVNGWRNPKIESNDISQFQNKDMYPFMIGNCCESAKFNKNSFAEDIVRVKDKGAVAYIGASDFSYWDEDYYWAIGVSSSFNADPEYEETGLGAFDGWFHLNSEPTESHIQTAAEFLTIGNLAVQESNSSLKKLYWEIYHLIGDPTLVPAKKSYELVSADYSIPMIVNQNSLTVNTISDAQVSLTQNGSVIANALANESGIAELTFNDIKVVGNKQIEILISHPDFAILIDSIDVIPPNGPYLILNGYDIIDSNFNNNGLIEYNEKVLFDLKIKNLGVDAANNVAISLATNNEWVDSISNAMEIDLGNIDPENEIKTENSFVLHLKNDIPNETIVRFTGQMDYNDTIIKEFSFNVEVRSPEIIQVITDVDVSGIGNNDEILQTGEQATLNVWFKNAGAAQVSNTTVGFYSTDTNLVLVENEIFTLGGFSANESKAIPVNIQVKDEIFEGTKATIAYQIYAGNQPQLNYSGEFDVLLGVMPIVLMENDASVEIVNAYFYDSGGENNNYSDKENSIMTFVPHYSEQGLSVDFEELELESGSNNCFDYLEIYNGASDTCDLIGSYCKANSLGLISSNNDAGALTFKFLSDISVNKPGWKANIISSKKHKISFVISDDNGRIDSSAIVFNGTSHTTSENGELVLDNVVECSKNTFKVIKDGYFIYTGSINDVENDTTISVLLESTPKVCFIVASGVNPIANAQVILNNKIQYTNEEGKVFYTNITEETLSFYVGANGFNDTTGYVTIPRYDISYNINLSPLKYCSVNLLVFEELGVVDSAKVNINGNEWYTDSLGKVQIDSLFKGNFQLNITKEGYKDFATMLSVPDSNTYKELEIFPKTYAVIFTVVHGEDKVANAHVLVNNYDLITSSQGQVSQNGFRAKENIPFTVNHNEYESYSGFFTVVDKSLELVVNLRKTDILSDLDNDILIYPNPNNGKFVVKVNKNQEFDISIINQEGKCVYKRNKISKSASVNLSGVTKGMYVLQVKNGERVSYTNIIIQ